jgi:HTH-type transcriptional regulator/antitoxin HigA
MRIHPIRTEADHDSAVARIAKLIGARPDTAEGEELDILATLVDAYEARHHAIDAPDPIAAIQFRMEQQGLTRKNLEPLIGSRARVSEIMTRRRPLTLAMIRRVRDELGISADLLLGHSEKKRPKSAHPGKFKRGPINSNSSNSRRQTAAG